MYTVKVRDTRGVEKVFACGTIDQVLDRLDALALDEVATARVKDPAGKEWSARQFRSKFDG